MNDCKHCNAELFSVCECLTSSNNHSDSDLSLGLPLSQYATHTYFVSHVDKLMSNELSLLHCNIRSLYKNIDKLEEIVIPCSKPPAIIALEIWSKIPPEIQNKTCLALFLAEYKKYVLLSYWYHTLCSYLLLYINQVD